MGFFKKFKEAWLASMTFDRLDDDFYEELEEALILADIGAATAADTGAAAQAGEPEAAGPRR